MEPRQKNSLLGPLLVLPYTLGFLLFYGYPFLLILRQSAVFRYGDLPNLHA